jgi:hypothetical protein
LLDRTPEPLVGRCTVKAILWAVAAGVLVAGSGVATVAEARDGGQPRRAERRDDRRDDGRDRYDDRRDRRDRYDDRRDRYDDRRDRYFGSRDILVIRDYYRPHYRPLPRGVRQVYARRGYLPPGWARRIHPVPVYVERRLPPIPRGYQRGIIDGHVVVHNSCGFILDLALLF